MPLMKCGHLTVAELQVAEKEILTYIQEVAFLEVFQRQNVVRTTVTQRRSFGRLECQYVS